MASLEREPTTIDKDGMGQLTRKCINGQGMLLGDPDAEAVCVLKSEEYGVLVTVIKDGLVEAEDTHELNGAALVHTFDNGSKMKVVGGAVDSSIDSRRLTFSTSQGLRKRYVGFREDEVDQSTLAAVN